MDLAGASGPGINSILTHTHKCTDTHTHMACTWVSCEIAADNVETPPHKTSTVRSQDVSFTVKTHTHRPTHYFCTRRASAQSRWINAWTDVCQLRAATKRRHQQLYLHMCMCAYLLNLAAPGKRCVGHIVGTSLHLCVCVRISGHDTILCGQSRRRSAVPVGMQQTVCD